MADSSGAALAFKPWGLAMAERRQLERFVLQVPAIIRAPKEKVRQGATRDISAFGAYLVTDRNFKEGTAVTMEIELPVERFAQMLQQMRGVKLFIKGVVVRSEADGMAVRFSRKYRITAAGFLLR